MAKKKILVSTSEKKVKEAHQIGLERGKIEGRKELAQELRALLGVGEAIESAKSDMRDALTDHAYDGNVHLTDRGCC